MNTSHGHPVDACFASDTIFTYRFFSYGDPCFCASPLRQVDILKRKEVEEKHARQADYAAKVSLPRKRRTPRIRRSQAGHSSRAFQRVDRTCSFPNQRTEGRVLHPVTHGSQTNECSHPRLPCAVTHTFHLGNKNKRLKSTPSRHLATAADPSPGQARPSRRAASRPGRRRQEHAAERPPFVVRRSHPDRHQETKARGRVGGLLLRSGPPARRGPPEQGARAYLGRPGGCGRGGRLRLLGEGAREAGVFRAGGEDEEGAGEGDGGKPRARGGGSGGCWWRW